MLTVEIQGLNMFCTLSQVYFLHSFPVTPLLLSLLCYCRRADAGRQFMAGCSLPLLKAGNFLVSLSDLML